MIKTYLLAAALTAAFCPSVPATTLDDIGVTALRAVTTNVDGAGLWVAQPEGDVAVNPIAFEVNPANVGLPARRFAYFSGLGATNVYPNNVGANSWHADNVAQNFYGLPYGVATNVAQVNNYDADFYVTNYISNLLPAGNEPVVNQSFTFGNVTNAYQTNGLYAMAISDQQAIDSQYDDYAVTNQTLFVSAVNNQDSVSPPGTSYNCLGVGAYGGGANSSIGPTLDNGRCKPDLVAPAGYTSFSTPLVSGAAAVLMQAAWRGDGGSDTNAAGDLRTIKALLLNGAVKPADWTNGSATPLDARYGAGVVNVFNAYEELVGGKQNCRAANAVAIGAFHPPGLGTNPVSALSAWDWESISSRATNDMVNHYFFTVPGGAATATLVWNRQLGQTNLNDLDLFMFDLTNSNLVAGSTSRVDNVEQLFVPQLAAGSYDLQVLKHGGPDAVSEDEVYAVAWAFVSPTLNLAKAGTNAVLTWAAYPAGFRVEAATNLIAPVWATNGLPLAVLTNSRNSLILHAPKAGQFFRLRSPNL